MKIPLSGLLALALAPTAVCVAAPDDKIEPPAQYTLQMGDKTVALTLGKEVETEGVAGQTRLKLSRQPLREFNKSGVRLRYPVDYTFEADLTTPNVAVWTMSGASSSVMLQRFPLAPAATLRKTMTDGLVEEYGRKNVTVVPTTLLVNGRKIAGDQLKVVLANQRLVQEVFTFSTAKNSFVLVIQDTPDKNAATAEFKRLKTLVGESLRF